MKDMDTSILRDIGLSDTEIKVFMTLLELGETKAGKLIEKSKLQSSSVYNALHSLMLKSLVSFVRKSEVKYYKAADPSAILDYIDLKKNEFMKILPALELKRNKIEKAEVEIYKGYRGIKTLLSALIKDARKMEVYRTFSVENSEEYSVAREKVFSLTKKFLKEKKLDIRGIFHENTRYGSSKDSIMQKRYVDFPMLPNSVVFRDKVGIISWGEEPVGILIHSNEMAKKYSDFFEYLWKIGRK